MNEPIRERRSALLGADWLFRVDVSFGASAETVLSVLININVRLVFERLKLSEAAEHVEQEKR